MIQPRPGLRLPAPRRRAGPVRSRAGARSGLVKGDRKRRVVQHRLDASKQVRVAPDGPFGFVEVARQGRLSAVDLATGAISGSGFAQIACVSTAVGVADAKSRRPTSHSTTNSSRLSALNPCVSGSGWQHRRGCLCGKRVWWDPVPVTPSRDDRSCGSYSLFEPPTKGAMNG